MKLKRAVTALLCAVLLFACAASPAQVSALEFHAARVPVGQVFHFEKSRLDGSHSTRLSVYVASVDRVESLKWEVGGESSTLVTADIDWTRFSVRRFEAWQLVTGAEPRLGATLAVEGDSLVMSLGDRPPALRHFPWHSYDFDFTSLNLAIPHLRDPRGRFTFWRTDFVYADPPSFAEIGAVTLRFERHETRAGVRARRYSVGGPGLEGLSGTWWADAASGLLVEFEIPVGDEPGYPDVRMRRLSTQSMSHEEWTAYQRNASKR